MVELSRFTSPASATARVLTQGLLLRPLMRRLVKVTVLGEHRIQELQAPFVAVANHSSHLDTPLIYGALPARLAARLSTGVAGDYFFDVWWRKGLTSLTFNAFPISRSGSRDGRWRGMAGRLVDHGVPLLIYPEGTRARTDQMAPFKPGPAALSRSRGVACLPIGIVGTAEAMPPGASWPVSGRPRVCLAFGTPLLPEAEESVLEFNTRIQKEVQELVDEATAHHNLPQPTG